MPKRAAVSFALQITQDAEEAIALLRVVQQIYAGSLAHIAPPQSIDERQAARLADDVAERCIVIRDAIKKAMKELGA